MCSSADLRAPVHFSYKRRFRAPARADSRILIPTWVGYSNSSRRGSDHSPSRPISAFAKNTQVNVANEQVRHFRTDPPDRGPRAERCSHSRSAFRDLEDEPCKIEVQSWPNAEGCNCRG